MVVSGTFKQVWRQVVRSVVVSWVAAVVGALPLASLRPGKRFRGLSAKQSLLV